uniref:Glycosyltransferase RgtA/B/C/D-like domain-containing protein n=1 Tax=candidate division WOR-3 bacterium TaxID=2052148 RepID=A0A7C4U6G0_UNCW3
MKGLNHLKIKDSLIVFLLFIFIFSFKFFKLLNSEGFNFRDDTGVYWTESAFQYKIAKEISKGNSLSELDKKLQYPEGFGIKRNITILMMSFSGLIYRFFIPKNIPFILFLSILICLYSSISIFPLYYLSMEIFKDKIISLLICIFYAVSLSAYITVINIGYEFQDFAVPFIFLHILFFVKSYKNKDLNYGIISGIFLLVALLSWLLTIFYFILFLIFCMILYLVDKDFKISPLICIVSIISSAYFIFPVLQAAGFIYSLPMLLSYSFIISYFIPEKKTKIISFVIFVMLSFIITFIVSRHKITGYGVVYSLIMDRMKVLLFKIKKETLPYETLVMWVSPFNSPSIRTIILSLGILTITGILGSFIGLFEFIKKERNFSYLLLFYFTILFFLLYLFFIRMDIFLLFFLSISTGMIFKFNKKIFYTIAVIIVIFNFSLFITYKSGSQGPTKTYLIDLLTFIRKNTEKNEPVLATFPLSATILAYTDRPILLHPKFEREGIIKKNKDFEKSLFYEEESLFSYCKKYGAKYVVYQTDILLSTKYISVRYRTHNLTISKDCVAFKMHFEPENLKHFQLLYSNPHYRFYKVSEKDTFNINLYYLRIYDEKRINLENFNIY